MKIYFEQVYWELIPLVFTVISLDAHNDNIQNLAQNSAIEDDTQNREAFHIFESTNLMDFHENLESAGRRRQGFMLSN